MGPQRFAVIDTVCLLTVIMSIVSPAVGQVGLSNSTSYALSVACYSSAFAGIPCLLLASVSTPYATLTLPDTGASATISLAMDSRRAELWVLCLPFVGLAVVGFGIHSANKKRRTVFGVLLGSLLLSGLMLPVACGGGGSSSGSGGSPGGGGTPPGTSTYTTSFPLTENPISEGGKWINGGTTGLDWSNIRTTPGLAFGTQTDTLEYDDSTAILAGSWGANQTVQATVGVINQDSGLFEEVELRVRTSISAHNITGYEINCSVVPSNPYMQIVRWNGPLANSGNTNNGFTQLTGSSTGCVDGDVLKATIVGSTITAYKNGVQMLQVTDGTFPNGNPGIGFYIQGGNASQESDYGFSSFTATDGSGS